MFSRHPPPRIHLVQDEKEFWHAVTKYSGPSSVFEDQGKEHGQIDLQLAEGIESVLVPLVGPWERSDKWFHNTDFYRDGIRSLVFRFGDFPPQCIPDLRALLIGDAAAFCISVQFCSELMGKDVQTIGGIAIMQNDIVSTHSMAHIVQSLE